MSIEELKHSEESAIDAVETLILSAPKEEPSKNRFNWFLVYALVGSVLYTIFTAIAGIISSKMSGASAQAFVLLVSPAIIYIAGVLIMLMKKNLSGIVIIIINDLFISPIMTLFVTDNWGSTIGVWIRGVIFAGVISAMLLLKSDSRSGWSLLLNQNNH